MPPAKKARRIVDVSPSFARALADSIPASATLRVTDLAALLVQPLPRAILVEDTHTMLLATAANVLSVEVREGDEVMISLESLLEMTCSFGFPGRLASEEDWASSADDITGRAWSLLTSLSGSRYGWRSARNVTDPSYATTRCLRPDYCGWYDDALVVKAEHKLSGGELGIALSELTSKMAGGWNALAMRGAPFLPCYAVGGPRLQFAVVHPGVADGKAALTLLGGTILMDSASGRLQVLARAFNMFRVISWLRHQLEPLSLIQLHKKVMRPDGTSSITVHDNFVEKETDVIAPPDVYALLDGSIPCAIQVRVSNARLRNGLTTLVLRPVAIERKPRDELELQKAVRCVLRALVAFHNRGFVHRDIRWPNVLSDGKGGWILTDFELAASRGVPVPERAIQSAFLSPEARVAGAAYEPDDDVWQVGMLVKAVADVLELSDAGRVFAAQITGPRAFRPGAAAALELAWVKGDLGAA